MDRNGHFVQNRSNASYNKRVCTFNQTRLHMQLNTFVHSTGRACAFNYMCLPHRKWMPMGGGKCVHGEAIHKERQNTLIRKWRRTHLHAETYLFVCRDEHGCTQTQNAHVVYLSEQCNRPFHFNNITMERIKPETFFWRATAYRGEYDTYTCTHTYIKYTHTVQSYHFFPLVFCCATIPAFVWNHLVLVNSIDAVHWVPEVCALLFMQSGLAPLTLWPPFTHTVDTSVIFRNGISVFSVAVPFTAAYCFKQWTKTDKWWTL